MSMTLLSVAAAAAAAPAASVEGLAVVAGLAAATLGLVWLAMALARGWWMPNLRPLPRGFPSDLGHWLLGTRENHVVASQPLAISAMRLLDRDGVDSMTVRKFVFPVLVTRDAALARRFLVTHNDVYGKPEGFMSGYRELRPILGNGLVLSKGETWKAHRKIANPAFAPAFLRGLVPTFDAVASELCERIKAAAAAPGPVTAATGGPAGQAVVDLGIEVAKATVDIIGAAGFGVRFGCLADADGTLPRAIFAMLEQQRINFRTPFPRLTHRAGMRQYDHGIRLLRELSESIIAGRRQAGAGPDDSKSLLGYLLKAAQAHADDADNADSPGMSDENLVDQTMTFLLAGHETTATTVSSALSLLLRHPLALAKVVAEVDAQLPSLADASVSFDTVQQLTYMDLVFKETLRICPSIAGVGRSPLVDDVISGTTVLPKGAHVAVSIYGLHRNPRYWGADADKFDPERWLDPDTQTAAQIAYLPFSLGPRNCIGLTFAQYEMRVLLARLLRAFSFTLAGPAANAPTAEPVQARDPLFVHAVPRA